MKTSLFVILLIIGIGHVQGKFHQVRPELRDLLPKNMLKFMDSFTPEDEKLFEETDDSGGLSEYLKRVGAKNPKLAQRGSVIVKDIVTRMAALDQTTSDFVKTVMGALDRKLGKLNDQEVIETAKVLLAGFDKLTLGRRSGLKAMFPSIHDTLLSDKFKELAKGKL
ncbi:unnamed protein product [Bursaphelenchus xylophilus]|uniref:(pine wood nematode) hypothetical protein n=1 Tax=Bursaphelenchus xylophilus TaxID=6326 RepID=A0A1I7SUX6_BURXY|nr:unnamed protein product [Bursaphelenchus xylophilus]CAG9125776.1 unnamed protein product [Bursaphelenchus xylophilus]